MPERYQAVDAARTSGATTELVVVEEPLTVRLAARDGVSVPAWTTLRTPGHDLDLALGWCVGEGIVGSMADVLDVHHCTDTDGAHSPNDVTVRLDAHELPATARPRAGRPATAACGLCGRDDLHAVLDRCAPLPREHVHVDVATITTLLAELPASQPVFAATGGAHAAGLATSDGRLLHVREDVGRHNAVDAVVGAATRALDLPDVLLLSGRAGFELVAKAVAAGIPVVASVGGTTDLAVRTARAAGITLVTFVGRAHGGTALSRPDRLGLSAAALVEIDR